MKLYRTISLGMAVVFLTVGLVFLIIPDGVLSLFNVLSDYLGMRRSPMTGVGFFLVLAVAYMYVVALLAWSMFRFPENGVYPKVLIHAKLASAAVSFGLFLYHQPYLIYLTNGVVDGLIGAAVFLLYRWAAPRMAGNPAAP